MNKYVYFLVIIFICFFPVKIVAQENQNKLIALLVNPMSAGQFGQFKQGEKVVTTMALLRVIDLQISNSSYYYLVILNSNSISQPFYILTNRKLELMDIPYPNTIFEALNLEYIRKENYFENGVYRETLLFKLH